MKNVIYISKHNCRLRSAQELNKYGIRVRYRTTSILKYPYFRVRNKNMKWFNYKVPPDLFHFALILFALKTWAPVDPPVCVHHLQIYTLQIHLKLKLSWFPIKFTPTLKILVKQLIKDLCSAANFTKRNTNSYSNWPQYNIQNLTQTVNDLYSEVNFTKRNLIKLCTSARDFCVVAFCAANLL